MPASSGDVTVMRFDLRSEPWIPVVRLDGTRDELSLVDTLLQAAQLREISDPLPTVEFGLYRLLVAVVLDILQPPGLTELAELFDNGVFDERKIRQYFDEHYPDRFDLFHTHFPFLQSADMDDEAAKPLAGLLHPIPSGTNANHFHHRDESDFGVCPAVAARLLTTMAPFTTAGGAGLSPSINGAPPWYLLPRGATVFHTVCLNVPAAESGFYEQAVRNLPPAWARTVPVTATRRNEAGLVESMTWQPRRIQLLPGHPGVCSVERRESQIIVRAMRFKSGFGVDFPWTDPNAAYMTRSDEVRIIRPQEDRAVWRDTGPLLLLRRNDYQSQDGKVRFERPAVISQFVESLRSGWRQSEDLVDVVIYGMRTDMKMKVFEWQREVLSLPIGFVWGSNSLGAAQTEMECADGVAFALKQAVKRAYPREGAGNSNAYNRLVTSTQSTFWESLRQPFSVMLVSISQAADADLRLEAIRHWRTDIQKCAWASLDDAIGDLDTDSDALERATNARRGFAAKLKAVLFPEQAKKKKATRTRKAAAADEI